MTQAKSVHSTPRRTAPSKALAYQPLNSRAAFSKRAIRIRIALIGRERKIPKAEIAKALTCRDREIDRLGLPENTPSVLIGYVLAT